MEKTLVWGVCKGVRRDATSKGELGWICFSQISSDSFLFN